MIRSWRKSLLGDIIIIILIILLEIKRTNIFFLYKAIGTLSSQELLKSVNAFCTENALE